MHTYSIKPRIPQARMVKLGETVRINNRFDGWNGRTAIVVEATPADTITYDDGRITEAPDRYHLRVLDEKGDLLGFALGMLRHEFRAVRHR